MDQPLKQGNVIVLQYPRLARAVGDPARPTGIFDRDPAAAMGCCPALGEETAGTGSQAPSPPAPAAAAAAAAAAPSLTENLIPSSCRTSSAAQVSHRTYAIPASRPGCAHVLD